MIKENKIETQHKMERKQTKKKAAKTKPLQTYFNLKIFSNIFA